jgi:amino acid transporter
MAFHNTAARYLYSLGREGVLPASLGRTHPTYRSPHIGSITQSVLAALIILAFCLVMGTDDPTKQAYLGIYGLMALVGTALIMFAQAIVSLAIIFYFVKNHPADHHWFETLVAPGVAFLAQMIVLILLFTNMDFLGGGLSFANWILWIDLAVLVIGYAGALYLKSSKPEVYDQLGRMMYEGIGS